jgi:ammonium transporter, Amt family
MGSQVVVQLTGIVATALYTAVLTFIVLKVVSALSGFRVTPEEENTGLDIVLHNESGYDL